MYGYKKLNHVGVQQKLATVNQLYFNKNVRK